MKRAGLVCLLGFIALIGTSARAGGGPIELTLTPASPNALDPTRIELRSAAVVGLRVQVVSPVGRSRFVRLTSVSPGLARGYFRYATAGQWHVRVVGNRGRMVRLRRTVTVHPPLATPPPAGFGPLGSDGYSPPSPANAGSQGLRDVYGTAVGREELWALPFLPVGASWARTDAAVFEGLVGKEMKIVLGMTSYRTPFRAVGPAGVKLSPAWGPKYHSGSNWDRQPGYEWGAGFVFPAPGCWRISVGSYGSVYLSIRS